MAAQTQYWVQIAEYDLETAGAMLQADRYLYVGFMCHQAIEKVLKAIYTAEQNAVPPKIHSLGRLLKMVDLHKIIPDDLLEVLNTLTPLNIATRYPDQDLEIMLELDHPYTTQLLENTRRLFEWLKTKLPSEEPFSNISEL